MAQFHVYAAGALSDERPEVRRIQIGDLRDVLMKGVDDFRAKPSHAIFVAVIYPIVGVVLARWSAGADAPQLVYPLLAGFALVGPFAALFLYEISRRREAGMDTTWRQALAVRRSPAIPGIATLGLAMVAVFLCWLYAAETIYQATFGARRPESLVALLDEVFATRHGWTLILVGNAVGALFAAAVLSLTVVAFPMMLDRDCGVVTALRTSWRVTTTNPGPIAVWGLIVAIGLFAGALPLFAGLAVVVPILGHATWHLYRLTVPQDRVAVPASLSAA